MRSEDVIQLLKGRFHAPEWVFLEQVANGTGGNARRRADGVAMNLWPSRGCEIHGIEVKVSRTDWLSELRNPAKADDVASYCDRWWLATDGSDIVRSGELPPTWGLLVPDGVGGMRAEVEAGKLDPVPLSRGFVASVLRKACQQATPEAEIKAAVAAAVENERDRYEEERKEEREKRNDWYTSLKADVDAFEAASGLSIRNARVGTERLGRRVAEYLRSPDGFAQEIRFIHRQLQKLTENIDETARQVEGRPSVWLEGKPTREGC